MPMCTSQNKVSTCHVSKLPKNVTDIGYNHPSSLTNFLLVLSKNDCDLLYSEQDKQMKLSHWNRRTNDHDNFHININQNKHKFVRLTITQCSDSTVQPVCALHDSIGVFQFFCAHSFSLLSGCFLLWPVCCQWSWVWRRLVLHVSCYCWDAINKLRFEEDIGIVEHSIFQWHHNKLKTKIAKFWLQFLLNLVDA